MDRFVRFRMLRALWARARALLAWLHGPQNQHLRLRMQRWQQAQVAERQIMDGIVRSSEDPDARLRPPVSAHNDYQGQAWQWQREGLRQWREAQRHAYEAQQRNGQPQRRR